MRVCLPYTNNVNINGERLRRGSASLCRIHMVRYSGLALFTPESYVQFQVLRLMKSWRRECLLVRDKKTCLQHLWKSGYVKGLTTDWLGLLSHVSMVNMENASVCSRHVSNRIIDKLRNKTLVILIILHAVWSAIAWWIQVPVVLLLCRMFCKSRKFCFLGSV